MSNVLSQYAGMEAVEPAEQANVHPSEEGLATAPARGQEEVNAKDRLVLGFWRDAIDAEFPNQGFEYLADPLTDHLDERFERIKLDAVLTRRSRLESSTAFRHPIPYILIHRYNEAKGCIEFFIYQRTKAVGEQLLAGNHSLAGGGHPEAKEMCFYPNMTLNIKESLLAVAVTELDEEFEFNGLSFSDLAKTTPITFTHDGFIRDDMNEVGKQHLGVVYSVGIPPHIDVVCKEAELITVGFRSLEEILSPESGFNFERWSYMIADHLHRLIEEERAKAAARGPVEEPVDEAVRVREEADRVAKLPPVDLTEADALQHLNTSGFNLLEWELEEGEKLVTREGRIFIDTFFDHPMDGRKTVVIGLDPEDPNPVSTVAEIKATLLAHWDPLKGNPVPAELGLMDGDLPEEPLETGEDGCELEQEDDGDIPDSGEDPEEPTDIGRGTVMETVHRPDLDALETRPAYPRGQRPEFAHIDEASFRHVEPEPQRYDPAPHRDADVGGYGDSGGSSSSSDSGSSSSD